MLLGARVIAVFFLLISGMPTLAQVQKAAFDKAVDYCNCRIAFAYAGGVATEPEKSAFERIKGRIQCDTISPISSDHLRDILQENEFRGYADRQIPIYESIKHSFHEGMNSNAATAKIIDSIFENPSVRRLLYLSRLDISRSQLLIDVRNILDNDKTEISTSPVQEPSSESINPDPVANSNYGALVWVVASVLFVSLGWLVIRHLLLKRRRKRRINRQCEEPTYRSYPLQDTVDADELKKEIQELEVRVGNLTAIVHNLQHSTIDNVSVSEVHKSISEVHKPELFYAAIPNPKGNFDASSVTKVLIPGSSFYAITQTSAQHATFTFLNELQALKDALRAPDLILYPICDIENNSNSFTESIRTVSQGKLVLQGDKWMVTVKARIAYE